MSNLGNAHVFHFALRPRVENSLSSESSLSLPASLPLDERTALLALVAGVGLVGLILYRRQSSFQLSATHWQSIIEADEVAPLPAAKRGAPRYDDDDDPFALPLARPDERSQQGRSRRASAADLTGQPVMDEWESGGGELTASTLIRPEAGGKVTQEPTGDDGLPIVPFNAMAIPRGPPRGLSAGDGLPEVPFEGSRTGGPRAAGSGGPHKYSL